jgi:SsrA-binding protein
MHRSEINKLAGKMKQGGSTLIPLSIYFKDGKVKVELALAHGKKAHDKRQALLEKQSEREVQRAVSRRGSGKSEY